MKIADMHCDTISQIWERQKAGNRQQLFQNSLHVDIQKMQKANYLLQNFALYVDLKKEPDPFMYVLKLVDVFQDEMQKNKKDICFVQTYDEIIVNEKQGKISALMTVEEGGCCKGEIQNLETLYQLGARMMTLTWNYPNELASPNIFEKDSRQSAKGFPLFDSSAGLTENGFLFIERMEELGMIIDVSHLSDAGFWDIAKHTEKPFVASHSNARALCGHARNLTDDMIRVIANRGGVIGLNCYGRFLNAINDDSSRVARMAQHARHILNVGGGECLGLGTDFDGINGQLEIQDCSQMYKLVHELERQHFTESEIENILFRNVMRVYKELL
ncbi:MAG: dipeptidase [Lachnospiraceae bacterium]|jgi:Zn-dependent dipeptidase, microsomal dipeptidase homolog